MWNMNNTFETNSTPNTQPLSESILTNQQFVVDKEHLFSDLNGEAVILSLKNGKYYGLNGVGVFIWSTIQNPTSFEDIQTNMMDEYDVDEETCRREVLLFLEKMTKEGIIQALDGKSS
jgi:hypothetical protein